MGLMGKLGAPFRGLWAAKSTDRVSAPENSVPSKLVKAQQSRARYFSKSSAGSGDALTKTERRLINTDITTYRSGSDTDTVIRDFSIASPDLSASLNAYIRTAVTGNYVSVAKNLDGTFNADATMALQSILTRFDVLNNYGEGFSNTPSIRALAESLAREFRLYGAAAVELVLDKQKNPIRLQPVSVSTLKFELDKSGQIFPTQEIDNTKVSLDIPTFFYRSIDQDLLTPYALSPMEAALQPVLFMQEFMNDLRRVVKRALFPRLNVKLNSAEILAAMPPQYRETPEKTNEYLSSVVADVADHVNGLSPEDAMVYLDTLEIDYLSRGNVSLNTEIDVLQSLINGKASTGSKTMPSILGQGSSSNNIASTETLLFMKSAEGVQFALNDLFSQALTLAVRILGYDVFVEFTFERIDLRPESELEAFRSMKQSRVLELLSLGMYSDAQASLELIGKIPDPNAPKLSGTMFKYGSTDTSNPYSGTSQGTLNQNLNSDQPTNAKSQNGGKKGN
ncbi:hypothetical protein CRG49_000635 [Neisseria sp. N95_16]|uniref:Phage portal protein n=1 Tax=Neisseria brasiliensis TaxID=2666100 RepID=A0A7X2GZ26_9NEIS|nr:MULTISPECIES: hypothetical protein [Neisseria]MRN38600.1 hypothetical protein [Neisseria brasiliensis]PJO10759.1 hypothetical protein CRG49_000635 [Neisseria sp. N95_16]